MNSDNTIEDKKERTSQRQESLKRAKELLTALLESDTPAEIKKIISDWFKSDASEEAKYDALEEVFEKLTPNLNPGQKDYETLTALHEKLGLPERHFEKTKNAKTTLRRAVMRIAAVLIPVLVLLGGAYFWGKWGLDPESDSNIIATETTVSATDGDNKQLLLADDSQVEIKAGSTVRYPQAFDQTREVFLSGEAVFKVAKKDTGGVSAPFSVRTEHVTVRVLGTEFKVTEYPESDNTVVMLYSGAVEVSAGGSLTRMKPGECFEYNHLTDEIRTTPISVSEMISEGYKPLLTFVDSSLEDIIRSVEENYGVKFIVPDGALINRGRFSANFTGEPIEDILELITLLDDKFTYRLEGDRVIMSNK